MFVSTIFLFQLWYILATEHPWANDTHKNITFEGEPSTEHPWANAPHKNITFEGGPTTEHLRANVDGPPSKVIFLCEALALRCSVDGLSKQCFCVQH
jgi:hypothetical protein